MHRILSRLLGLALSSCATVSEAGSLADLAVVDRSNGQRVMTVVSVDGVNVVTGETAAPEQNVYVLDRGMNYEITGWRKSTSEIAAFVFTALPDSYAARTERPDNVGVIGVAVFREWPPPRPAVVPQSSRRPVLRRGRIRMPMPLRAQGCKAAPQSTAAGAQPRPLRLLPRVSWRRRNARSDSAPVTANARTRRSATPPFAAPASGRANW
ncbi:MAG: hypothetical protein EXR29_01985 [Betaproteobacteria bacterium]|nr:hypothetical protein [Betaproteobacteria bacterium]